VALPVALPVEVLVPVAGGVLLAEAEMLLLLEGLAP
jgi:hypothetical protein